MPKETEAEITVDETAGLKAKNSELLGKLKKQQAEIDELLTAKEEAETEAATKAGDIEKLKQQLEKKHQNELDKLRGEKEALEKDLRTIRVDNAIATAISKGNIIADHVDAVEALLQRKVSYEDGVATIDGQSIEDWSKTYFSKAGAIYVNAANNSGANISSNDGSRASPFTLPKTEADITPEMMKYGREQPEAFNAMMAQAGLSIRI
jgi:predicted nuclease with TOPRIM domain